MLLSTSDKTLVLACLPAHPNPNPRTPIYLSPFLYTHTHTHIYIYIQPYIRELTLKAMPCLAPKLTERTLTSSLLKHLAKAQIDPEPGIRANTTILLGLIAKHLPNHVAQRVLVSSFQRAFRDSFPPSRVAALRAIVATMDLLGSADLATKR